MDSSGDYRLEGFKQGFRDGQRTCGNITKKYTDTLLERKTCNLSQQEAYEYISGWFDGYANGVSEALEKMLQKKGFVKHSCESFSQETGG